MNKGLEDQVTVKTVREKIRSRFKRMMMRMDEGHSSNNNKNEVALVMPPSNSRDVCSMWKIRAQETRLLGNQGHQEIQQNT